MLENRPMVEIDMYGLQSESVSRLEQAFWGSWRLFRFFGFFPRPLRVERDTLKCKYWIEIGFKDNEAFFLLPITVSRYRGTRTLVSI